MPKDRDQREKRMMESQGFLIDDFSREDGLSAVGTRWQFFTDQVMGGVSTGAARFAVHEGRRSIRLQGRVSLENNGGFIQVALPLVTGDEPLDASNCRGVRIWARGNEERYGVHIRTSDLGLPWQYYSAEFAAGAVWKKVDLPFSKFRPESSETALNPSRLTRVAIVAADKAFKADVAVSRLKFYR